MGEPKGRRKRTQTLRVDQHPSFALLPRDRCTLTKLSGRTPGSVHPVSHDGDFIIGRDEDLSMRIDDRGVSRRHARVYGGGGAFWIEDLQSTNGTFVDGALVTQPLPLNDGGRIQLGEYTLLRVSRHDAAEQETARRMYHAAVLDPLTGVYNRGHFDATIVSEFAFSVRHAVPLSILFVDLDFFTVINNRYGHQGGDEVLRQVANVMRDSLRIEDLVTRYGGEEFVIIARGIRAAGAMIMAERLRLTIDAHTVAYQSNAIRLTASIGVASNEPDTSFESHDALIAAADRALYRAKADGRNRVCQAYQSAPDSWQEL